VVIGPVNHGYLELVCRETVCGIRAIKDLLRPVHRGSRKEIGPGEWFTEPPKKELGGDLTPLRASLFASGQHSEYKSV
jgi:hypothetical protein